ncbi:calcium-binding protein [Phaeobacter gallaeciensis]|uniref:calcium-binding protein n=1 Tax=Phaeobacter gallaeciensis TaxID=60890 RepID=UPI00237FB9AF|nr:calcium-binding protein [Phaeobacter gallaeciensis]MDE4190133.1 calcium-binding protein [Phaeobacter gallaeciensis]MDE4198375.1 calcium-binding protein [Phaeobacter gallaeciensis]MDE4202519.1 calcium-binding protein [Phaeobacter gallaeciensis]MDE4206184.1 calcium-binding protein [Phaeobacter gallaeciensis]MDE4214552.1 calcium-binding protein [Phaeobacter gallaeciensis]
MATIVGTSGNDPLTGTELSEGIYGFEGDDTIDGSGGQDTLFGGDGNDVLTGGSGTDLLFGGDGDDVFYAFSNASGHDDYSGGADNDQLIAVSTGSGSSYSVSIGSVSTVETFINGRATQTVNISADGYTDVSSITNLQTAGDAMGSIIGGSNDDYLSGFDLVNGGVGWSDNINAGSGNDTVYGNAGNDTLNGAAGDDQLNGGVGDDVLTGGTGADEFRFNSAQAFRTDVITDFEDGLDQIELFNSDQITSFNVYDLGASGTAIEVNSNLIVLQGFDVANLDSTDFDFVM